MVCHVRVVLDGVRCHIRSMSYVAARHDGISMNERDVGM